MSMQMTRITRGMARYQLIRNRKTNDPMILISEMNRFSGPWWGEFGDIEQIGNQLAHHLTGVVLIVVEKESFFVVVEQLLTHVPFHVGAHHVALVADIVLAQALHDVHDQEGCENRQKSIENDRTFLCEQGCRQRSEDLRISQVYKADHGRADQIQKEDRLVR